MFRDVTPLVRPRTVAVVGASARRVSQGNVVVNNLREWGFSGVVVVGKRDGYDRYFVECDIATVSDYDELIGSLECMSSAPRRMLPGARIAVVGISGGQTALACHIAEDASVPLAELSDRTGGAVERFLPGTTGANPVDIGASVREEKRQIREAVGAVLADDAVDGLALIQDAQASLNPRSLRSYEPILSSYSMRARRRKNPSC